MINIGQYIETAINWLTNNFATFFDTLRVSLEPPLKYGPSVV